MDHVVEQRWWKSKAKPDSSILCVFHVHFIYDASGCSQRCHNRRASHKSGHVPGGNSRHLFKTVFVVWLHCRTFACSCDLMGGCSRAGLPPWLYMCIYNMYIYIYVYIYIYIERERDLYINTNIYRHMQIWFKPDLSSPSRQAILEIAYITFRIYIYIYMYICIHIICMYVISISLSLSLSIYIYLVWAFRIFIHIYIYIYIYSNFKEHIQYIYIYILSYFVQKVDLVAYWLDARPIRVVAGVSILDERELNSRKWPSHKLIHQLTMYQKHNLFDMLSFHFITPCSYNRK